MSSNIEYDDWRKASFSNGSGSCVETASRRAPSRFATRPTATAERWRSPLRRGRRSRTDSSRRSSIQAARGTAAPGRFPSTVRHCPPRSGPRGIHPRTQSSPGSSSYSRDSQGPVQLVPAGPGMPDRHEQPRRGTSAPGPTPWGWKRLHRDRTWRGGGDGVGKPGFSAERPRCPDP